jgi:hypothetical protein
MKVLILNADYDSFLERHYSRNPHLITASYADQMQARLDTLYGVCGAYSRGFRAHGHDASEVFVTNVWMQTAWAREHGMTVPDPPMPNERQLESTDLVMQLKRSLRGYRSLLAPIAKKLGFLLTMTALERQILLAQIEHINPDVILNPELQTVDGGIMHAVKRPGRVLIAQCGNEPPPDFDATPYNFGVSLIPWVVEYYRSKGIPGEHVHLAFDPNFFLERLPPKPKQDIEVSFVGGLGSNHGKRIQLLEAVAREFPVELYLSSFKGIPKSSPLHERARGEAWGRDMYDILRRSKITLNTHIDASRGMAGNMRLYEATGVGTFLLTDNLPNLPTLFEPCVQVGAYDSVEDCLRKIKYYLANDSLRETIAAAGQIQTAQNHTYLKRVGDMLALIAKYSS